MSTAIRPLIDIIGRDGFVEALSKSSDPRAHKLLEAYNIIEQVILEGESPTVQHVGDHDVEIPPGLRMMRDVQEVIISIAYRKDVHA